MAALASDDLIRFALLRWMTPFWTALSTRLIVGLSRPLTSLLLLDAVVARNFFRLVRKLLLVALFRS